MIIRRIRRVSKTSTRKSIKNAIREGSRFCLSGKVSIQKNHRNAKCLFHQSGKVPKIPIPNWKSPEWPTCQGPNFANLEGRDITNSEGSQFGCVSKTPTRMDFKTPSRKGFDFVNPDGHDPEESQKRHYGTVRKL